MRIICVLVGVSEISFVLELSEMFFEIQNSGHYL